MIWLIAEDEADIRMLITAMISVWGHDTLAFENGQKVWDWLDRLEKGEDMPKPQIILMDIRMPGKKGNEVAHRMRTLPTLDNIPIVLMTAYTLSASEERDIKVADGVDHIIYKPLPDFEELRALLYRIVEEKKQIEKPLPLPPLPLTQEEGLKDIS